MSGSETEESDTEMSVDSNANMPADDEDAMSVDENFDVDNAGVTRSQIESRLAAIQSREIQEVNVTGEPGHIQQIVLENFMCHENFKVDLGPRINFIIGPNGSGKSAILAAIILGLGSRASTTNRGSGLNSFIKTHQNRARVSIKLCNYIDDDNKDEGYLPDKYGKSITIERTIYASGVSNYKIRDQNNKVISEKKDEVDNITKHFDILVDNPVCVLTQEVSKNFLNSKNPKDKFKFFIKATQLEETKKDYEASFDSNENSERELKTKLEIIKMYKEKFHKQEKQVKIIKMLKNSVTKMKFLAQEGYWAICNSNIEELENERKKLQSIESEYEQVNKNNEDIAQKVSQLESQKVELTESVETLTNRVEAFKQELDTVASEAMSADRALSSKQREIIRIQEEIRRHKQNIKTVSNKIAGIESQNRDRENINFEAEIEQINVEIQTLHDEQNSTKEKIGQLNSEIDEAGKKHAHYKNEERLAVGRFNSANSEIDRLRRGEKNRYERYSNKTSHIMEQIELAVNSRKFKKRPYGPIAEFIRLQDQSAAFAAETLLSPRNLNAFIVDNFDDSKTLKQIFQNVMGQNIAHPDIIVRKYVPLHDFQNHQAQSNFPTFLQLFNIKEPEVANCLIDHFNIEKILYIPNYQVAQKLLLNPETSPINCRKAFTEQGDSMMPATDRNDFKCYVNKNNQKTPRYLIRDTNQAVEDYKNNARVQKEAATVARQQIDLAMQELTAKKQEFDECEITLREIRTKLLQLTKKRDDLMEKSQIQPVEVIALKEDIERFTTDLEDLENQLKEYMEERNKLRETFDEKNKLKDEKEAEYNELVHSRLPTKGRIEQIDKQLIHLKKQMERFSAQKNDISVKKGQIEASIEAKLEEYNHSHETALANSDGKVIETTRKHCDVMAEVEQYQAMISQNKEIANAEKQDEIIAEYQNLLETVQRLSSEYKELNKFIQLQNESMQKRKMAYLSYRFYVTRVVNYFFSSVLKQKEFSGSITPYFCDMEGEDGKTKKAQTLDVVIYPRNKEQFTGGAANNQTNAIYTTTKSLSGGERSYSTVAFIIALWQICPSPFRLLDEVDVFMDMVTRKISIDTLIWFATERSSKQFIFLSPLGMQQLEKPECVTINYMPEPARK